jgi:hypothetical protein
VSDGFALAAGITIFLCNILQHALSSIASVNSFFS